MSKEIKIGLISVASIAVFYWVFTFLNGKDVFTSGQVYYVTYTDVDGLLPTRPVNVNGLKVGAIDDIKIIEEKDSLYFVVKMVLDKKINFTKNTVAEIYEPGLMAGKQIKLNLSYKGAPAESGDTLIAANTQSLMTMLSNKLKPTQNKLDSVLTTLNFTLDRYGNLASEDTNKSLKQVLDNLNKTIQSLELTSNSVRNLAMSTNKLSDRLDSKIDLISENTNNALVTSNATLKKYGDLADNLNDGKIEKTLANLEQSSSELKAFLNKVENSDGSLNKIINDKELYNNLNHTAENLNLLIKDVKQTPGKYFNFSVFGKKVVYKQDSVRK